MSALNQFTVHRPPELNVKCWRFSISAKSRVAQVGGTGGYYWKVLSYKSISPCVLLNNPPPAPAVTLMWWLSRVVSKSQFVGNSVKHRSETCFNCLKLCFNECKFEMWCALSIFTVIIVIFITAVSGLEITLALSHNLQLQKKGR